MRYDKIDPGLLLVWRARKDHERLEQYAARWAVSIPEDEEEEPRVRVWIHCDEEASLAGLERRWGVHVVPRRGSTRSALIPLEILEELSERTDVRRLTLVAQRQARLDIASAATQIRSYRAKTGAKGRGTLIGIIDTGIDGEHPDFAGRILAVWDQQAHPDFVDADEPRALLIGGGTRGSVDSDGHGTHVAGIAAAFHPTFCGVAPEADLIVVKCDGTDANIAEGIRFVFDQADKAERPAVVNLSWGGHLGSHDGREELSQRIDEMSGPRKIVCCAAGNEGDVSIHARVLGATAGDRVQRLTFDVPPRGESQSSLGRRMILLEGWYSSDDQLTVGVDSVTEDLLDPAPPGEPYDSAFEIEDVCVTVSVPPTGLSAHASHFQVVLTAAVTAADDVLEGRWTLLFGGSPHHPIDVWILDSVGGEDTEPHAEFAGAHVSNSFRIGAPGSARRAITVANVTTRASWPSARGGVVVDETLTEGHLDPTSSNGPLRDGFAKPDIAAPGSMIVAPRSSRSPDDHRLDVSETHRAMGGTSMASPFVAGVVALLFDRHPDLTPEHAKEILSANAQRARGAGRMRPEAWGAGIVRLTADETPRVPLTGKTRRTKAPASSHSPSAAKRRPRGRGAAKNPKA